LRLLSRAFRSRFQRLQSPIHQGNHQSFSRAPHLGATGMRFAEVSRPDGNSAAGLFRIQGDSMQWSTPAFEDMRFGFEITMYISHR